jgi:hypothetical protein
MHATHIKKCFLLIAFFTLMQTAFAQVPVVSSFSPASGPVGSAVTITGANFSGVPAENIVYFGPVKAQVLSATAGASGSLVVKIPSGAAYGLISVAINGLVGQSSHAFVVTYLNGGPMFDTGDSFGPKTDFAINTPGNGSAYGVSAADFDGDGKPDMAVMDASVGQLYIYKNTGNSTTPFNATPTIKVTSGYRHYVVTVADLNGDGKLDLITGSGEQGSVSILKNISTPGNIAFAPQLAVAFNNAAYAIETADFDGDGKLDIAVANGANNTVAVRLNTGTGNDISFAATQSFSVGQDPLDIALGDIDGDGKADIVASNHIGSTLSILRNISTTGNISFADRLDINSKPQPYYILLSDIDGDGKQDIVTTNHLDFGDAKVGYIYQNTSTAGAPSFIDGKEYFIGPFLMAPAVADMDGDGKPDLVVVDKQTNNGNIIRNQSTPGNVSLTSAKTFGTFSYPSNVAVADFNGDGKPDVVVTDGSYPNTASLMLNQVDPLRPTVVSCTPARAGEGTTVTLNGTNFTDVASVTLGGKAATSFTVVSPTTITAVVPLTTSGNASVTNAYGTGNYFNFVFIPKPVVSKVTVSVSGAVKTYTITGLYLGDASAVSFDGTPAASYTNTDNFTIVAKTGLAVPAIITIKTPGGTTNYSYYPLPTISGFSPSSAKAGDAVTITGTNFTGATAVAIGGTPAASYVVNSAITITAVIGAGSSGTVKVTTPGGSAFSSSNFSFIGQPIISSFSPTKAKPGDHVTITGTNLSGATSVTLGGVVAALYSTSPTSVTVVVGAGASGSVVINTPGGTASMPGFTYVPAPQITSFTNDKKTGETVTVSGINFTDVTAVSFGGVPAQSFTVKSATSITAVVGLGNSGSISITAPLGTATATGFKYVPSAPVITSFTPTSAGMQQQVTITGTDFIGTYLVKFGGTAASSFIINSITSITATVGAGANGNVTVTTSYGIGTATGFTFASGPVISSFTPTTAGPGKLVTLTGSGLSGATSVTFGGTAAQSFTINSPTSITAIVAAGASGDVVVTTPAGKATLGGFSFEAPIPTITSFTPTTTGALETVMITGTNFTGVTKVSFGGTDAASFGVNSATSITALVSNGSSGTVAVTTPQGTASLAGYVYKPVAATITSFTPTTASPGETVTITGTTFTTVSNVKIGGVNAASFTVLSPTTIKAVVGNASSGNVSVTTQGGTASLAGFVFKPVLKVPTITSFTPTSTGPLETVMITGTNFTGVTKVSFGGTDAASFGVNSATSITALVDRGSSGAVTVTTPGGTASLGGYVYKPVVPTITSFTPTTAGPAETVKIIGTDFTGVTNVSFGGTPAASFTINSPAMITAVVGSGSSGPVRVFNAVGIAILTGFVYKATSVVPAITSIVEESSAYGTLVGITGGNFSPLLKDNIVYFGAARADVHSGVGTTKLSAVVPAGATNQSVSVTANGLTAYSGKAFSPNSKGKITKFDSTSFTPKVNFATAAPPTTIVTADLDGDGKADVVNVNYVQYTGNTITVNRNTSTYVTIAFDEKTVINTGAGTTAAAAGDVNGDGKLDLVVSHGDAPFVVGGKDQNYATVYINNSTPGNINFVAAGDFKSLGAADMMVVKDLDGDGKPEIILWSNVVVILKNVSSGGTVSFAPATFITATQSSETNIVFTDIDNDTKPDLVLTKNGTPNGALCIFKNTSTGSGISFTSIGSYPLIDNSTGRVAAADLNGDGKTDFIVTSTGSNSISIFKNISASAGSISFDTRLDYPTGKFPSRVATTDINGDGKPDVVVSNSGSYTVSVFANTTLKGQPISLNPKIDYRTDVVPQSVEIADLDQDGLPDLIVGYPDGGLNGFSVLRNSMVNMEPVVSYFFPAKAATGATVTIRGEHFTTTSVVSFGQEPAKSFTVVSDTTITAVLGLGASGRVQVTTPYGSNGAPNFEFIGGVPPTITAATPLTASRGDTVMITGTNFIGINSVSFGGVLAASFKVNSPTSILAVVGPGATGDIVVATAEGNVKLAGFVYNDKPSITSFTPTTATQSNGVTITGKNFAGATAVTFGGVKATFTVSSSTTIYATIGNGASGDVAVTTPAGTAQLAGFVYISNPLIVTFTPTSAATGQVVTLKGHGFTDVNKVVFGGVDAASFKVLSDTVITAVVGAGATGKIEVSTILSSSTAGTFTYISGPLVTAFNPAIGGKGSTVIITGINFDNTATVTFGGVPAKPVNVTSATEISAVVGEGTTGNVSVTTTKGAGSLGGFYYVPIPIIKADGPTIFAEGGKVTLSTTRLARAQYQWYRGSVALPGATDTAYAATESGSYSVKATVEYYSVASAPVEAKSLFFLPATNFKVALQSLTCKDAKNGTIHIKAVKTYNYKATVTGPQTVSTGFVGNDFTATGLQAGTYNICITIPDKPDYQQCFSVVVEEPKDLSVYIAVNKNLNTITLNLNGSDAYEVRLNDKVFHTNDNSLTIPLTDGSNTLVVNTAKLCQGIFRQIINITGNHAPYPNPFMDALDVNIGEATVKTAVIKIFDVSNGRAMLSKIYSNQSGIVRLDVSGFKSGVYSVHLTLDNRQSVYKIIKK